VTATAARRKSGRKLVTGVQFLAFPNGGDPPKGRSGPGLRPFALCPPKLRGQCGMNKIGCLTRLRFFGHKRAVMAQVERILIISCCIIPV
jgi:hypothetical protein